MSRKSKGINAERELIHAFWEKGWASIRVAGSGSSRYPSPDVLAGNGRRRIAIECKASGNIVKYLTAKEVSELQMFAKIFGAEPWIGMRFDDMKWHFLSPEDLNKSGSSFSASIQLVKKKGLIFDELIEL
ncbi:Holliday junction resolvase [Candidatus Woesearchaeota archaeon]|nr:Holliday junction resolvase [Candidatus Woesearchaeota archaeon]